uniref:Uncharacterized protein n=1 Tax=Schistosoma curassoni TaxID=6186 RepID=A0A183KK08_9TREM
MTDKSKFPLSQTLPFANNRVYVLLSSICTFFIVIITECLVESTRTVHRLSSDRSFPFFSTLACGVTEPTA